jgi:ketosteroid isomerase-like protein
LPAGAREERLGARRSLAAKGGTHIAADAGLDAGLKQAIALLSGLLSDEAASAETLAPWQATPLRAPTPSGRVSATDRLSWWFRPAAGGADPWSTYFDDEPAKLVEPAAAPRAPDATVAAAEPLGRRAALRLLLAEPEEELIDADADAVVTCLYDFAHALGRRDVATAIATCVADDYHVMEGDEEIDRDALAAQLAAELDRLRGWELDTSLVEIPQPILHPDGILVYTELQIDARKQDERRTVLHRRLAVFRKGSDRTWRIVALSPV